MKIARKYSATFGNLRTSWEISENDWECLYELRTVFGEFPKIFGKKHKNLAAIVRSFVRSFIRLFDRSLCSLFNMA